MIMGKRSVQLPMQNGEIKTMKDVCYVPGLNRNLLSIGQITNSSNLVLFTSSMYLVLTSKKPYKKIVVGRRDHETRLYKLLSLVKTLKSHRMEVLSLPLALSILA